LLVFGGFAGWSCLASLAAVLAELRFGGVVS
jgi:hypothetical protein